MNDYIEKNQQKFINELFELLKIASVSADTKFAPDVFRAADWVAEQLSLAGAENVKICPTKGFPIVYGEKIIDPALPTVLVYGHYDVQPADPYELWDSPPFEPIIKDGKIFARGACDDKGQMFMHIKALEVMLAHDSLPCNIKFMIEGEEEVGSDNLAGFLEEHKQMLAADVILVSDTSILSNQNPSITVGLRGLAYMLVEVSGPNRDLHSGIYGGAVANPINVLCKMIASLTDENNHILIPGFYDKVIELNQEERAEMAKAPFSEQAFADELEVDAVEGEAGYTSLERKSIRPTLDVNGMWGGYTGQGAKTVLPAKAYAKISMRLVPDQTAEDIAGLFKKHFEQIAPKSVKVQVVAHHGGDPALTPTDSIAYKAASMAFEQAWGIVPIPMREGGSIPIVPLFEKVLGIKTVLMGFGLDSDAIHSPNEHFHVFNFLKGIETIPLFYKNYVALWAAKSKV